MEQNTAHKLVVNPEQSGGMIAVATRTPKGDNLQFTQEKRPSPPPRDSSPHEMYSSDDSSPRAWRHRSPSVTIDVSGLANPDKMRRSFREHSPSPSPTPRRRSPPPRRPSPSRRYSRSRSRSNSRPPPPKAPEPKPSPGFGSIREEKLYILLTLKRMKAEGVEEVSDYTIDSDIEEMRMELRTLQEDQMMTNGIESCRTALITVTTGLEIMNKKYNPFDLDLDGWSQSIFESIERYDTVLERLVKKYGKRVSAISPEIQLMLMLCGSAASFCFTKSMMKAAQPTMTRIAEENPELVRKMMQGMAPPAAQPQGVPAVPVVPVVPVATPVVPTASVPVPQSSRYAEPLERFVRPAPQAPNPSGGDDASSVSLSLAGDAEVSGLNDSFSVSSISSPKGQPAIRKVAVGGKGSVTKKRGRIEVNFE
ncbi:hypothetical protein KFL_009170040 [Klebsormidium nitens]|uniref:Uncharacterized protein n=1 Tax=Klebsormidium nitens TaxID=105231 RepID=A0A1Y1IMP4_KLENI|nr:hypothetical protein KFL_009170040 [Klebsormidium nitens]|eukprot:GAQ92074.1 hypothetical protein KFL_009170040 [Klebsormidium nitens]